MKTLKEDCTNEIAAELEIQAWGIEAHREGELITVRRTLMSLDDYRMIGRRLRAARFEKRGQKWQRRGSMNDCWNLAADKAAAFLAERGWREKKPFWVGDGWRIKIAAGETDVADEYVEKFWAALVAERNAEWESLS